MRILWLKTELLHPIDKGGKIRTYHMLRELKRNHRITYLTLDDGSAGHLAQEKASEYCDDLILVPFKQKKKFTAGFYLELALNLASKLPYAISKYQSSEMTREITSRAHGDEYDLIICDFLAPAVNLPEELACPVVLFEHNVEADIWRRHYEVQSNPLKKAYLFRQWRKMTSFEKKICQRCDAVVAVSRNDRETISKVYEIQNVEDVPTGVDTNFFRPTGQITAKKHSLIFTGSMDWLPNEDAIQYFVDQIMPFIQRELPDVTLTVVGRNPSTELVKLAERNKQIIVTGRVDDVRPYIEQAVGFIVPIRIGGGTRLKIYEAMAMAKPVISTTIGAEGLPLRNGHDVLIADEPAAFAGAVVKVLTDGRFAEQLGQNAAEVVTTRFGWPVVAQRFGEICESVVGEQIDESV